jgi:hypothetical protein
MTTWSRPQIAVMALAAGWGTHSQDVSWVAMAESGGDDHIVNSIGCVGLLQINQPVQVAAHPTWTRAWLQNPQNNLIAGRILFKEAGNSFDRPWADSKDKGGIPEGWGPHVSAAAGGGSSGAVQAKDDPCHLLAPGAARDFCKENHPDIYGPSGGTPSVGDTAEQLGRLAQAIAKAGNWLSDPGNWVRIAYVVGGGLLALTAVNVIIQPYAARTYRQVAGALPVRTVRDMARQRNTTTEQKEG